MRGNDHFMTSQFHPRNLHVCTADRTHVTDSAKKLYTYFISASSAPYAYLTKHCRYRRASFASTPPI